MSKRTPNGWQMTSMKMRRKELPPAMPTRWSRLLYRHSVSENDAILAIKTEEGKPIRDWVRHHYNSAFVPEKILEVLGIDTRWIA